MRKYYQTTLNLWKLLKPFHNDFYIQISFIIIMQAIGVATVYFMSSMLDKIVKLDFRGAYVAVFLFFSLRFSSILLDHLSHLHLIKKIDYKVQQHLQFFSFRKVFLLNASQYIEDHSAVKLQVIDRGENSIEIIIRLLLLELLPIAVQLTFYTIAVTYFSPLLGLVVILFFTSTLIWTTRFSNKIRPLIVKNRDNWDIQRRERAEAFQHLSLIKLFDVQNSFVAKYFSNRKKFIEHSEDMGSLRTGHSFIRDNFLLSARLIVVLIVINSIKVGAMTVGSLYAIWSYTSDIFSNIYTVLRTSKELPIKFVELEKYLSIINKSPDFNENGTLNFAPGSIEIRNLNFKYPKSESNVLNNISLTIPYGTKAAFVGISGSGKSTILKILLRVYDYSEGSFTIGGQELKEISSGSLRKNIGYVEQHVDLFDTTIKDNILFGLEDKNISEEKLQEVVHKSRIYQFFHRLTKNKLDTEIGERGIKLSGGERQRIGIARALIKDPAILIFDEATASLDTENEKYIQEAIDESSLGRTSIIIAHRLSTVQNADVIFVMHKGELVGSGTHAELLANNSYYQNLVKHQY